MKEKRRALRLDQGPWPISSDRPADSAIPQLHSKARTELGLSNSVLYFVRILGKLLERLFKCLSASSLVSQVRTRSFVVYCCKNPE
jgi:hypothetical protein